MVMGRARPLSDAMLEVSSDGSLRLPELLETLLDESFSSPSSFCDSLVDSSVIFLI